MLSILYSLFVYKLLTVAITSEYIVNILYSMINTHNHADYSKQWCCLGRTSLVYCHERRIDTLLQNQMWPPFPLPSGCSWVFKNKENLMRA
jgi:hypothetical protein